ncbi:hypothetical protein JCM8547_006761 [Rhodosporidiobolus lusitaniae]
MSSNAPPPLQLSQGPQNTLFSPPPGYSPGGSPPSASTVRSPAWPEKPFVVCRRCHREAEVVEGKRLALFFDGTTNTFGEKITNVPTLVRLVDENPRQQLIYYQTGIGTGISTHDSKCHPHNIVHAVGQAADAAIATSLRTHIMDGYKALSHEPHAIYLIYLFGFSRGAFTARALVGMLQQVGLLSPGNEELVPLAYSIFKQSGDPKKNELTKREKLNAAFKLTFSREVKVHFVGVWDTVSSVGGVFPTTLPFSNGCTFIHQFRQVLALDERRGSFGEQVWKYDVDDPGLHTFTRIKEIWMPGSHSACGGGLAKYDSDASPSLSHISARWMVREALAQGLAFDAKRIFDSPIFNDFVAAAQAIDSGPRPRDYELVDYLAEVGERNPAPKELERELELVATTVFLSCQPGSPQIVRDSLAPRGNEVSFEPVGDTLVEKALDLPAKIINKGWKGAAQTSFYKTLEWFPLPPKSVYENGQTQTSYWPNLSHGRKLPNNGSKPKFHSSVKTRLAAGKYPNEPNGYRIAATLDGQELTLSNIDDLVEWVD